MKSIKAAVAMSVIAGAAWSGVSFAADDNNHAAHGVFVMTNDADANRVIAFQRVSIKPELVASVDPILVA
jgi:hypothetical protein